MENTNDIVKLAVDLYNGCVENYSNAQAQDALRQALIEANNGKDHFDYRDIRDGKCGKLFAIIEEIIDKTVVEGLQSSDYFNEFVDFRNLAMGDTNKFIVEDSTAFLVATAADGTQGIRRQRLSGSKEITIPTTTKAVRVYEELNRVLAGRVDFNTFINKVSDAFSRKLLDDIYSVWSTATQADFGGSAFFVSGSFDADNMLDLIAHVEAAANGQPAKIICTKKAARALVGATVSQDAQNDMYHNGVYGWFFGTPIVTVPQRHQIGTTTFVMPDDIYTVVAGDNKCIKVVKEGEPLIIPGNPADNADLTQEYFVAQKYGVGLILAGSNAGANMGFGRYDV